MPKQTMKWRTIIIPVFGALLFFGALAWAKSDAPFSRKWFNVRTPHGKAECVAVLPKIGGEIRTGLPLVVYLHDSGGTLMTDGKELRQLAELGMVAVSLEYNQTNNTAFDEEYSALLDFLQKQPWSAGAFAGTNSSAPSTNSSVAWLGIGLGAQNQLRNLLEYSKRHAKPLY